MKGKEESERLMELINFGALNTLNFGHGAFGLGHYLELISESMSLEEACVLVLSIPNLANTRPYSEGSHNCFYCLAELTRSGRREIALCATWAVLGSSFYNTFLKIGAYFPTQAFDEFYLKEPSPPDDGLLSSAIAKIQIFLGESGPILDAYPRYSKVQVDGKPYRFIQRLVPEIKYDEAVKRFLKATHDQPRAGRALLKFALFEELVRGEHFDILDELEKEICENTVPGKVLTIEQVEAMGVYSGRGHACSAWRRLKAMKAMQKEGLTAMVICRPNGSRCNICGGFIPEGDFMCGNGHEPGESYPAPVS